LGKKEKEISYAQMSHFFFEDLKFALNFNENKEKGESTPRTTRIM